MVSMAVVSLQSDGLKITKGVCQMNCARSWPGNDHGAKVVDVALRKQCWRASNITVLQEELDASDCMVVASHERF